MRDTNPFLDWLNKIPSWIKGALGLVGVISTFIVAFRQNWYLYSTISVMLILLYILGTSLYVLLARLPSRSKKKKWSYRFEKQRSWGFAGLVFVILTSIGLIAAQPTRQIMKYAFVETPLPPQLGSPDVLIADFVSRYATRKMEVAYRLEDDLEVSLKENGMEDVNVQLTSQPVGSESEAQTVANQTGSKVVIWGWYDDTSIEVKVFLSGNEQSGRELSGTHQIPLSRGGEPSSELGFVVQNVLPENVSFLSLFVIGHLEYLSNHYEAGHKAFDAAMDNIPQNVQIANEAILHFFQARQMEDTGANVKDSICEYAKAIEIDPGFAEAYNNLGVILDRNIVVDSMNDVYPISEIPPGAYTCLEKLGIEKDALYEPTAFYERALEVNPSLTIAEFNRAAFEWRTFLFEPGAGDTVYRSKFEDIQRRDPTIVGTYIMLGIIHDKTDDPAGAIQLYEAGKKIDPNNALLRFNLGQLYLDYQKDEAQAESEFEAALSINPEDEEVHLALGNLLFGQGKFQEASRHLDAILKSENTNLDSESVRTAARTLKSAIYFNQDNPTQAIDVLSELPENAENDSFAYFIMGLLFQSLGQNEQAAANFRKAMDTGHVILEEVYQPAEANNTSRLAWNDFLIKCLPDSIGTSFAEWAVNELPNSNCLPEDKQQRINAAYEILHDMVLERRTVRAPVPHQFECPYLYTFDSVTNNWSFQTTILYRLANREATQMTKITQFDGRLLIREEESEISYINRLYVLAVMSNGSVQILEPQKAELKSKDSDYVVLHPGDEVVVRLDGYPRMDSVSEWWVVATGYYRPLQK